MLYHLNLYITPNIKHEINITEENLQKNCIEACEFKSVSQGSAYKKGIIRLVSINVTMPDTWI